MAYPLAGHVRSGDEIGRFSRTSKSAWLRVLMSSRLGWREPAGDRRYLSQDRSIIAKTTVRLRGGFRMCAGFGISLLRKTALFTKHIMHDDGPSAFPCRNTLRHTLRRLLIGRQIKALSKIRPATSLQRINRIKYHIGAMEEMNHTSVPPLARQHSAISSSIRRIGVCVFST